MKKVRRLASLLLAVCLLAGLWSPARAVSSGELEGGVTWTWDETAGLLTFSGNGPAAITSIPAWFSSSNVKKIVLEEGITAIGPSIFFGMKALTQIVIPDTVLSMGEQAFVNCSQLTAVELPDSLTLIPQEAFQGCSSLREITIPAAVTAIGSKAFYSCTSLTKISLPAGLASVGLNAFSGCTALGEVSYAGSDQSAISIAGGNDPLTALTWHSGQTIQLAAGQCENGTLTLPRSTTAFGDIFTVEVTPDPGYVFQSLTVDHGTADGLTVTVAPSGSFDTVTVTALFAPYRPDAAPLSWGTCGDKLQWWLYEDGELHIAGAGDMADYALGGAPWYGETVTAVTLDDTVTGIGINALAGCGLTTLSLSAALTRLGAGALHGCTALQSFSVSAENPRYSAQSGVLFNRAGTVLERYPAARTVSGFAIPEGVAGIQPGLSRAVKMWAGWPCPRAYPPWRRAPSPAPGRNCSA